MLNVESKILAALRGKPIVPMIGVAKAIEMAKKLNAARPAEFLKLIGEKSHD